MIRRATPADVPALVELVYGLAEFERATEQCLLTESDLHAALFGPAPALFAHVATVDEQVAGCAIWFLNFSTWTGRHGIYLEDLFVRPHARGRGLGKGLLAALAREAVEHGYTRVDWSVLDWNAPAIEFYRTLGAVEQEEWIGYRLAGEALARIAGSGR